MENVVLSEKEILGINSFVQEVSNILKVEAVYITPYFKRASQSEFIDIVVVTNISLYYNGKLPGGKEEMRPTTDIVQEQEQIDFLIQKFQNKFKNGRLSFDCTNSALYTLTLMHYIERVAEIDLISGTILFDRFGELTENRNKASEKLEPYSNTLQIENINKIKDESNQALVLVKK